MVESYLSDLIQAGFSARLVGVCALDRYCGLRSLPYRFVTTNADLAQLARIFETLRFPGPEIADAAIETADDGGTVCYLLCLDNDNITLPAFRVLNFAWDGKNKSYQDPLGFYPVIRRFRDGKTEAPVWFSDDDFRGAVSAFDLAATAAIIVSRYKNAAGEDDRYIEELADRINGRSERTPLKPEAQKNTLSGLLLSQGSDLGLKLLLRTGFVAAHWPELAVMNEIDHSKEYHPEGNVWEHTLETFRHRKILDLPLSLALLLHDIGKVQASASGGHRFDRHAELGALGAKRFLERLGYSGPLIDQVVFLVRNHMLPAALPRLPLNRTGAVLESPSFPLLLELYRCDEASSFKGLDGFYDSCAAYRSYLKNTKNPYRSNDGKLLMKKLFK